MPHLSPPEIWMPQATAQEKKTLKAIYVRIVENRGEPISQFIIDNPNYQAFYIQR